jgi:S-DNA-T family DNA segregation ATPase FtsK/SpoIIIE
MARTTPPTHNNTSAGNDTVSDVISAPFLTAWHALRITALLLWWALLFPMFSIPVAGAVWAWIAYGWQAGISVALMGAMLLAGWRVLHPGSFRSATFARMRARYRRSKHRNRWASVCALNGLTPTLDSTPLIPRLRKVRIDPTVDTLTVDMIPGQTLADWSGKCDALAHGWRVPSVTAASPAPGAVVLTIRTRDHLATPIPLPAPATTNLDAVTIGVTEDGTPWAVRAAGRHILVAGATGAGKGSVVWALLAGLAPAVTTGTARLWVIDPKGGMEFGAATALFHRFVHTTGAPTVELLRDAAALVQERANRYRGQTRAHVATLAEPQIVVVIDELASLTAYETDRKIATETTQLLSLILSQGRAVGVTVVAAAQDPSKDVLTMRQLFPTRIGLRLTEATQVDMVLGQGSRTAGALCDQIPDALPGVGYQIEDGTTHPLRARAFHVTDTNIHDLATRYPAPALAPDEPHAGATEQS